MNLLARWSRWRQARLQQRLFVPAPARRSDGSTVPRTRVSPSSLIEHADKLVVGEGVAIGPFNFIEASGGIVLGEGVQVSSHVAIVTHAQHRSQRLLGPAFSTWPVTPSSQRPGWIAGPVHIGAYTFVGPHSLIEANTRIGRGSLVCAGSFVRGEYPEFAILEGRPARVVGDTRRSDERLLARHPELRVLYEAWSNAPAASGFDVAPGQA